ncbi:MAG: phosphoribosylformylglycinamidine synthase subunit PurS [Dehalococcoidia bacterium]|nr:phosphoribosylformylglycinamidine synthase subunit PurS [Dehalococcoidia bacterium]
MTKKSTKNSKKAKNTKAKGESTFLARVFVSLKPTVNDPEGNTIAGALTSLGFEGVSGVRSGRYFQVTVAAATKKAAGAAVDQMCARLLANPVIETYSYEVAEA